jgi:hypothetical protein
MRHLLLQILFVWGGVFLLAGCSEKLDPQPATYSKMLTGETSKSWRLTTLQILEKATIVESIPLPANNCVGDDLYVFFAGTEKRFQVTEGTRKCSPTDPDLIIENNWSLTNANATLSFVVPLLADFPLPFILKKMTTTELSVEIYLEDDDDTSYRLIFSATGQ